MSEKQRPGNLIPLRTLDGKVIPPRLGWRATWVGRLLRLHSPGAHLFGACWCQR